jgi:hemoglobin/transferrin/lactoferrin receptor protein
VVAALLLAAAFGLTASMAQAADAPLGAPRPAGTAATQPGGTSPAPAVAVSATTAPATAPAAEPNQPAGSAQAPRTWLDDVLVTATRSEIRSFAAPYAVNTVNMQGFSNNRMYRTTTDALRDVPGVMIQKTSSAQGSPYIRGFTGYRTLMLVDGIRLNNSTFRDGPNQYWNLIDPYTIDRLEVVKGPSSVLYGSDAVGGTVNAVLRRPDGYGEGLQGYRQIYAQAASAQRSYVGRGEAVATYGPWLGIMAGGTWKDFGDIDGGQGVGIQKKTGYGVCSGDVKIEYHPDPTTTWTFAHYQLYEDNAWRTHATIYGTSWYGTAVGTDPRRVIDEGRSLSYVRYRKDRVSECFDSIELTTSFQTLSETQWRTRSNGRQDRDNVELQTYGQSIQFVSPSKIGKWTYGAEWYHDEVNSASRTFNADGSLRSIAIQGPVGDDASYDLLGVYVQDVIPLCERVDLTLGERYTFARAEAGKVRDPDTGNRISIADEWNSMVGSARLAWFVDPKEHWNVFGGVSQGFRAPNLSDLSRFDTAQSSEFEVAAPGLDPEKYISYETGVKAKYDNFAAQASYFYTDIRDMIVRTPTGGTINGQPEVTKQNVGNGYVQGVETGVSWRFGPQWTLFGALAWLDGQADSYPTSAPVIKREPLSRLMPTTTQVGLRWDHPNRRLWAETSCTFTDRADRLTAADRIDTQRIPPGGTPGYTVLDIRTGWKVCEGLDVWSAVENVTDQDYRIHGSGVNEPGTNFKLGAKWRF